MGNTKEAGLYLCAVAMGLGDLSYRSEVWEVELGSDRIPSFILPIGQAPNHTRGSKLAQIMVQEEAGHKSGMVVYPLIEQVR